MGQQQTFIILRKQPFERLVLRVKQTSPFAESGRSRAASFRQDADIASEKYWPFLTAQAGEGVMNYARVYDLVS